MEHVVNVTTHGKTCHINYTVSQKSQDTLLILQVIQYGGHVLNIGHLTHYLLEYSDVVSFSPFLSEIKDCLETLDFTGCPVFDSPYTSQPI